MLSPDITNIQRHSHFKYPSRTSSNYQSPSLLDQSLAKAMPTPHRDCSIRSLSPPLTVALICSLTELDGIPIELSLKDRTERALFAVRVDRSAVLARMGNDPSNTAIPSVVALCTLRGRMSSGGGPPKTPYADVSLPHQLRGPLCTISTTRAGLVSQCLRHEIDGKGK